MRPILKAQTRGVKTSKEFIEKTWKAYKEELKYSGTMYKGFTAQPIQDKRRKDGGQLVSRTGVPQFTKPPIEKRPVRTRGKVSMKDERIITKKAFEQIMNQYIENASGSTRAQRFKNAFDAYQRGGFYTPPQGIYDLASRDLYANKEVRKFVHRHVRNEKGQFVAFDVNKIRPVGSGTIMNQYGKRNFAVLKYGDNVYIVTLNSPQETQMYASREAFEQTIFAEYLTQYGDEY